MSPTHTHSRSPGRTDLRPAKAATEPSKTAPVKTAPMKTAPTAEEGAACRTPGSIARQLDEELEQSFPASDPPSMVRDTPATVCDDKAMAPRTEPDSSRKKGGKAARHHH